MSTSGTEPESSQFTAWCRDRLDGHLRFLEALVNVDSGPGDRDGLDAVADLCAAKWNDLGMQVRVERTEEGALPIVVARNAHGGAASRVMLLGHLDTVFPAGTVSIRPFRLQDRRAVGPGVADMKGGLATMALALDCAAAAGVLDRLAITVVNNPDEESGSGSSRSLIRSMADGMDAALVFEAARPDGSLVTARRGHRRFRVNVEGRAAHTGVNPEDGANAILEAARMIPAISALSDRERNVTVTVSLIEGGTAVNAVPDRAVVTVDARVPNTAAADEVEAAIRRIAAAIGVTGTASAVDVFAQRDPMVPVAGTDDLLAALDRAATSVGLRVRCVATGGGSDGGITTAAGVPTLDGLGPVGAGYHTDDEVVFVDTIAERAALGAALLGELARRDHRRMSV